MLKYLTIAALIAASGEINAQSPVPAPKQEGRILIWGATAHLGDGRVIANSAIAFENGVLTTVADAAVIRIDRSQFSKIFDASGSHVYPGFIASNTQLGLVEVEAVRSTNDRAETGAFNPNARSVVAYNTDSEVTPTVRSNGVLLAQITPQGGTLSGSSSVVQLDAWNWEDAAVCTDCGMHLNWPNMPAPGGRRRGDQTEAGDPAEQYAQAVRALERYFAEAKAYAATDAGAQSVKNARFEAMRGLFSKKQRLFVHTDRAKSMQEAVLFAETHGLDIALVGAADSWQIADFLAAHQTPVILTRTQSLPVTDDEDVDQPFKTPKTLHDAGVKFAITDNGSWQQRNLAFQAGQAVGFGLPYEAAVRSLTQYAAQILGIDGRYGALETGKSATLFISQGDALDMRTAKITAAFIDGREISLDDKQKELSRKYEEKYRRKE